MIFILVVCGAYNRSVRRLRRLGCGISDYMRRVLCDPGTQVSTAIGRLPKNEIQRNSSQCNMQRYCKMLRETAFWEDHIVLGELKLMHSRNRQYAVNYIDLLSKFVN